MADANPDDDMFSHCKVCNEPTAKTTILKHMSRKKTLVRNVLRTCKEHNLEEFNSIKDTIAVARKAHKREHQRKQDQENQEIGPSARKSLLGSTFSRCQSGEFV